MEEAGDAGFEYRGQTVFQSLFGGKEVVVILERDKDAAAAQLEVQPARHEQDVDDGEGAEGAREPWASTSSA